MSGWYVLKSSGSQFTFDLKAGNGETILASERYTLKERAKSGIASVQANSPYDVRYEKLTAKDGSPYFVLKAGNGEVIGVSEMYSTAGARDNGIESVKVNGPTTDIRDRT